jgi:hypothetical protein
MSIRKVLEPAGCFTSFLNRQQRAQIGPFVQRLKLFDDRA